MLTKSGQLQNGLIRNTVDLLAVNQLPSERKVLSTENENIRNYNKKGVSN